MTPRPKIKKRSHPIRDIFFGNITAKVMALVMALALWYYAYSASVQPSDLDVSVEVQTGEGWRWSLVGQTEKTVKVSLTYPRRLRERVARERNQIRIVCSGNPDPDGGDDQRRTITLSRANFKAPESLQIIVGSFDPEEITLRLLREETKRLPVEVQLSDPPEGYRRDAHATYARPSTVEVRGPKGALSKAKTIRTEMLNIGDLIRFDNVEVMDQLNDRPLEQYIVDENGEKHEIVCDETVTVAVRYTQEPKKEDFPDIPIMLMIPPDYPYVAVIPSESSPKTTVTISGPPKVVGELKPDNINLYVKVSGLEPKEEGSAPYAQTIQYKIVDVARAKELTVLLTDRTCLVKVTKAPEE